MQDLISRQAAIDALEGEVTVTGRANAETVLGYANLICDRIKRLPSADAVEVRHGRWIEDGYNNLDYVCSECGEPCAGMVMGKPRDKYCKWCGARMDGEQDG